MPQPIQLKDHEKDAVLVRRRGYQSPALDALLDTLFSLRQGHGPAVPTWISST